MKQYEMPDDLSVLAAEYQKTGTTLSSLSRSSGYPRHLLRKWLRNDAGIELKGHLISSQEANARDASRLPTKEEFLADYPVMSAKDVERKYNIGQQTRLMLTAAYVDTLKTHGEAVSIGKRQGFLERLPDIPDLGEQYKAVGFCKKTLKQQLGLTRYQLDELFEQQCIATVEPNRSAAEAALFYAVSELDPDGEWTANRKDVIPPYELDIYSEKHKMAIEYCGLWWHSEVSGGKAKTYHRDKIFMCKDKDPLFRLITVFETDPIDRVLDHIRMLLGGCKAFGAREFNVERISPGLARTHEELYHVAGSRPAKAYYGLFLKSADDTAIPAAVMTFGTPRFNKKHQWEIIRYTLANGMTISGGAQKLFAAFAREFNPDSIMTYADLRFGQGDIYGRLGFNLEGWSSPNYWYFHPKRIREGLKHRMQFQKHKLGKLLPVFDASLTEWDNMQLNGYDRIWDCGNAVYSWKSPEHLMVDTPQIPDTITS